MSVNWLAVAKWLDAKADEPCWGPELTDDPGQRDSLRAIADRLRKGQRSVLLADEVGMGKTLIAAALIKAVQANGGRSVVVIPPGLGGQWQAELRRLDQADRTLLPLRSYWTFLDAFRRPEDVTDRALIRERRKRELEDRRQQRQLPERDWSDEPIILLSHNLGTIRSTTDTTLWHKALISALGKVRDGKRSYRRDPASGARHNIARGAAERIFLGLNAAERRELMRLVEGETQVLGKLRHIIARGLGRFDLLIIDEAHKSRGTGTSLARVLADMTWESDDGFRLGMTATPVELDAQQWIETLQRLKVPPEPLAAMETVILDYVEAVDELRLKVALTPQSVERYCFASRRFQDALSPWVLRRDQRDDKFVEAFCEQHGSHREVSPLEISLPDMPLSWRRAFLADEAMSLLTEHNLTPAERRMRLWLPDGRRLAAPENDPAEAGIVAGTDGQRAWQSLASEVHGEGGKAIFSHPAITRTVCEIEALVEDGHKVLVFGKFTRPLRALTFLLDAREMVRRLSVEDSVATRWPESTLRSTESDQGQALNVALQDQILNSSGLDRTQLKQLLDERANRRQSERRSNLATMRSAIEKRASADPQARILYDLWTGARVNEAALLAALEDQRPPSSRHLPWNEKALLDAFASLVREVTGGADEERLDEKNHFEDLLDLYLEDFGSRREGHFARLMDGQSAPQTRRLLQAAFNREGSWPQVLVAQSAVGREGLNLQTCCRVVVMLHLEWNPGNVEQQIGRVDRIASRWRREAANVRTGDDWVPRILVRPVVVRGTYAQHQWSVLQRRWESLRAQLNGEVLTEDDIGQADGELAALVQEVRRCAPSFYPAVRARS